MPISMAREARLLASSGLPAKARAELDLAMDDACILYDRAESACARARTPQYAREQRRVMDVAREIVVRIGRAATECRGGDA